MKAKAHLFAFHYGDKAPKERPIEIPFAEVADVMQRHQGSGDVVALFEKSFYYGQNDFQPVEGCYSVSVGDVVEIVVDGVPQLRVVKDFGFSDPILEDEFEAMYARAIKAGIERKREHEAHKARRSG
jgi:hypothetical protein